MIVNRRVLKVVSVASTDPSRLSLQGVHVQDGHLEATNGHIWAQCPLPNMPPEECPADWHGPADTLDGTILDAPALAKLAKALPKKGFSPILMCASIGQSNGHAKASIGLGDEMATQHIPVVEGSYPNTKQIRDGLKEKPILFHVTLNAEYLKVIADMAKGNSETDQRVHFTFREDTMTAVEFTIEGDGSQPITGLLMPMRYQVSPGALAPVNPMPGGKAKREERQHGL